MTNKNKPKITKPGTVEKIIKSPFPHVPEKAEIAVWFRIWLETPDAFFDLLEVRKQAPDFRAKFPQLEPEE